MEPPVLIDISNEDTTFNKDLSQCESVPKHDDYFIDLPIYQNKRNTKFEKKNKRKTINK